MFGLNRREFLVGLGSAVACGCRGLERETIPRISVFSLYIGWAAKLHGVSEEEIAARMLAHGVTGIDAEDSEVERVRRLCGRGMELVNMYGFIHFLDAEKSKRESERFLSAAIDCKAPRMMVIPDDLPDTGDRERALDRIAAGLADFTATAKREGIETNIEDFGSSKSPCARISCMKRMFEASADLGFVIDTGNFFHAGCGDDILDAFRSFRSRIRHVHLKDRPKGAPRGYAPLGTGCIPNEEIVKDLAADGYRGWFTLEEAGAKDIARATYDAAEVLGLWLRKG